MVVGHTVRPTIEARYDGRLIAAHTPATAAICGCWCASEASTTGSGSMSRACRNRSELWH
jgi:hypothetical protein